MSPVVLILTHPADVHADVVAVRLGARSVRVHRHDTPDLASLGLALHIRPDGRTAHVGQIDLSEVTCVWHRRPSDFAGPDADELRAAVGGLLAPLPYLNHPAAMATASLKTLQLVLAQGVGLHVPCTTVATDPTLAGDLGVRVVVKPLTHGVGGLVDEDDRAGWSRAVSLTQARIRPAYHVRVTYVDGDLFGTRIVSPHLDWRRDLSACTYAPVRVVDHAESIHTLMGELDLRYGALDFVVDRHDRWWFLEVNPNGQWLWLEQATGQPIAAAVARALCSVDQLPAMRVWADQGTSHAA